MPDKPTRDTHIDRLELFPPTYKALQKAGLTTLGMILDKTEAELIEAIGNISYWELRDDILTPNGLAPKPEPPANENSPA